VELVVSLYAGTTGYLDSVPVVEVKRFETVLLDFFRTRHGHDLVGIRSTGDIVDVMALEGAIKDFVEQFSWEEAAAAEATPATEAATAEDAPADAPAADAPADQE
jgi:F-type H+-transporting ATPase subunit alpha